jgi:hypothetical protein
MSQNSNSNSNEIAGVGMMFAVVGAVAMMFLLFFYVVFAFIAVVVTIACLFAWNSPLHLGDLTIRPDAARRFVYRGLAGSVLLAAFCIFTTIMFGIRIEDQYAPHILLAGYTLGSVGITYLEWDPDSPQPQQTIIPPNHQIVPPPHAPEPPAQPFRFASWNDEDGR